MIYAGNVTWKSNRGDSGMYVYIADVPKEFNIPTPIKMEEGILDWKNIESILDPNNAGVVSNMRLFLPKILNGNMA